VEDAFVRVCAVDEIADGEPLAFSVPDDADPSRILVLTGGEHFALTGVCPHQGADLSEGVVENGILWCPVHSSGFDCRTGAVTHPPAPGPLSTYRVRIEAGTIHVSVRPDG
jgi:3-phenylpropionate/trans-cinnamate dioxygenase ferredoxin subunit